VSGRADDGSRPGQVVRRRALVSGRVQGVFFRDSSRQQAVRRGVAGLARNLPDGRVEVVLEGLPDEVAAVLTWLRQGPAYARVETVEVTEEPVEGLRGFEIG
jgi:acylphosphatase